MLALDAVVVVDVPAELALARLTTLRGMEAEDAQARQAAQPTREERLEGAEYVIDNSGDEDSLVAEVGRVWRALLELPQQPDPEPGSQPVAPASD
jgi:dephospho-CoA kinase